MNIPPLEDSKRLTFSFSSYLLLLDERGIGEIFLFKIKFSNGY
jgi:hypothetical protein